MAITCTHISLSPDKWECVEFNLRKEVEGSKAKKRKVSLPRVRQCGTRQHNAFRGGKFSKSYTLFACDAVVAEVFGRETADAVQDIRAAYKALREQWKDDTAFVLVATAHYCQRIRQRVTRAAILLDKCPELVEACHLYESVNQAIDNFI